MFAVSAASKNLRVDGRIATAASHPCLLLPRSQRGTGSLSVSEDGCLLGAKRVGEGDGISSLLGERSERSLRGIIVSSQSGARIILSFGSRSEQYFFSLVRENHEDYVCFSLRASSEIEQ